MEFEVFDDYQEEKILLELRWDEEPFCEHCGKLEQFDMMFYETSGGVTWCEACASSQWEELDKVIPEISKLQSQKKIEYFEKRIKQIKHSPS